MERHIAIIPARAGSKSIKDKNLIMLDGKTLIRRALEPARDSNIFSKIVISTDYPRVKLGIEDLGQTAFTNIIYLPRPKGLSEDNSLIIDTIKSVLKDVGGEYMWVWLLQPTSPFRCVDDFKAIKKALDTGEYEAAISFKPVKEFIDRTYTWKNGVAHRINQCNYLNKQDLKAQVHRSGNFYIVKKHYIEENSDSTKWSWELKPYYSHVMGGVDPETATQEERSMSRMLGTNIDDREDLELAKGYVRRGDLGAKYR